MHILTREKKEGFVNFLIKLVVCNLFFFCSYLQANWNDAFDKSTGKMLDQLVNIDSEEYEKHYKVFARIREVYLADSALCKQIRSMKSFDKEIILRPRERMVIKKRRENHIYEAFAWEIATLLGTNSCIVPSLPVEIGGKRVILQNMEDFEIREKHKKLPKKSIMKRVSLDAYWKAHFQAYLLGMGDLVGRNIGVNKEGKIRFFDIESSFKYGPVTKTSDTSFYTGFIAQSFSWPQFEQTLDQSTLLSLQEFVLSLDSLEENIATYLRYRSFPLDEEGFFYRLNKIRSFPLEEGMSFKDFYSFAFPSIGEGLEELTGIIGRIWHKKITTGEAILFAKKDVSKLSLPRKEKEEMQEWIKNYIK